MPFFNEGLPNQIECSAFANDWPKDDLICSSNAIGCYRPLETYDDPESFSCLCAGGWSGKGDFVSRGTHDCHISEDMTHFFLYLYLFSALSCSFIVGAWNWIAIRAVFMSIVKRRWKKPNAKTIAFLGFLFEGIWCSIGITYRLATGHRYGYNFVSTLFVSVSIASFLLFFHYFIKSWVKLSLAGSAGSSSSSSASSSSGQAEQGGKVTKKKKAKHKHILRNLKYQLLVCGTTVFFCFISTAFVEEEISDVRTLLLNIGNLATALSSAFMGFSLYKSGKELAKMVGEAGAGSVKFKKLGDAMLKTTRLLTWATFVISAVLTAFTLMPVITDYKTYVIPLTYAVSHCVPITISLLLTTPPWKAAKIDPSSLRRLSGSPHRHSRELSAGSPKARSGSSTFGSPGVPKRHPSIYATDSKRHSSIYSVESSGLY